MKIQGFLVLLDTISKLFVVESVLIGLVTIAIEKLKVYSDTYEDFEYTDFVLVGRIVADAILQTSRLCIRFAVRLGFAQDL